MEIRDTMLPVLGPKGGKEEIEALTQVIESGWWGKGPKVAEFEEKFAKMVGHKYAVAVTSASHGQDLVMKAMGFKGIDVINPTISFIATAMIPLWNDYTSNIVDVKRDTLCIDPEDVEKYKKPNSEVMIAVNEAGVPADYEALRKVFGGFILEDCAHSCWTPGAGQGGDVAVWSFQAVKTMPCGDGGMITSNDKELIEKCREMTWFGVSSTWSRSQGASGKPGYAWDYQVDILGYKYYMIDIMAAICLEQMKKLPSNLEFRRHVQKRYNEELNPIFERPPHSETVQYYCPRITPKNGLTRDDLIDYLADKKVHTSVHFKPLHKYTPLEQNREYPVADTEWLKLVSLPVHNRMVEEDIDYVIYWCNKWAEEVYENN
jgi:perosamine synthetase|tara:strand:+ start:295 stop:1419 length:1125 start_codon:yes stop_codon:yes gene_type:complete